VGEAGAGKSGCLYELAADLRKQGSDVIVVAVDQLAATSPGELDAELKLPNSYSLVDVLADWSGSGRAALIIDALDAARTSYGLTTLCNLIGQIRDNAPRWDVVASVREFDLKHSRDIQRLFPGQPISGAGNREFRNVKHVIVGPLTHAELASLEQQIPEVASVRRGCCPELLELTRNPFNLRLLVELIESNVTLDQFSGVSTQVALLDLYWEERIDKNEASGILTRTLEQCVRSMVDRRSLNMNEDECARDDSDWNQSVQTLESLGVLRASDAVVPGASRTITFSHTILFDYTVARLLLKDLPDDIVDWLGSDESEDLLLAIRPSLTMAFERLWHAAADRKCFWDRAICFAKCATIRPIGRIIPAEVAAREYRVLSDVIPLLDHLRSSDKQAATKLLHCMWQAALAHHEAEPDKLPFVGQNAPQWLALAERLAKDHLNETAVIVRSLLASIMSR